MMLLNAKLNPRIQTRIANGSTLFVSLTLLLLGGSIFFRAPTDVKSSFVLFIALTQCILYFSAWKRMAMKMAGLEFFLVAFFSMMFFSSGPDGGAGRALFGLLEKPLLIWYNSNILNYTKGATDESEKRDQA
ncbi:MAG: hypothetical protein LBL72_03595 [Candidatus Accumulibacter sp.]|jgi:hypothetical protein|nr:hypothetical protein [Accumulibacter sp.]